ncbi:class I SAM-dependent methyltransferase [Gammaproteobacteria bacterium]|nr:class I SAM-dependent methyltransferase [Gammaproteobacteria bacterium]
MHKMDEFKNIKGFLAHEEGLLLYRLAKEYCLNGVAVEIGSYCGKSACYIGQACKENNTQLITIDHHRGSEEQQLGQEYFDPEEFDYKKNRVDTLPTLLKNISKHELDNFVKALVGDSASAAKNLEDNLDLVFIDGSHTFESARLDYASWKGKIRKGGILAIHDIYDTEADGGQAPKEIYEKALKENFELIERVNSLVALRLIS